eukprot:15457316-Alexandrium_andersonii.AAC.1
MQGAPRLSALASGWAPPASPPTPRRAPPAGSARAGTSWPGASTGGSPAAAPQSRASGTSRTTSGSPPRAPEAGGQLERYSNPAT